MTGLRHSLANPRQIGSPQCSVYCSSCFRSEEEKRQAACRLEEWKEEKRRKRELEEEWRLAEEAQRRTRAKVKCVSCVFLAQCWRVWRWLLLFDVSLQRCFCQEERRRQLEVNLTLEERRRLRKEQEEEQRQKMREEEKKEMEERRRVAARGIKRFKERVRVGDAGTDPHAKLPVKMTTGR